MTKSHGYDTQDQLEIPIWRAQCQSWLDSRNHTTPASKATLNDESKENGAQGIIWAWLIPLIIFLGCICLGATIRVKHGSSDSKRIPIVIFFISESHPSAKIILSRIIQHYMICSRSYLCHMRTRRRMLETRLVGIQRDTHHPYIYFVFASFFCFLF